MTGAPLKSMKNVTNDSVAMHIIHTPFHFSAIVLTGEQTLIQALLNTSALYLNSLHKNFKHQRRIPLRNVDSAIIRDMCRDHSDSYWAFHVLNSQQGVTIVECYPFQMLR